MFSQSDTFHPWVAVAKHTQLKKRKRSILMFIEKVKLWYTTFTIAMYYKVFKSLLIIHKDKTKETMFNDVFICARDTLAVFNKFIAGFYGSNKVNLQKF